MIAAQKHSKKLGRNKRVRPNLSYIIYFELYFFHGFIPNSASSHLNLIPQNKYNKLATNTLLIANLSPVMNMTIHPLKKIGNPMIPNIIGHLTFLIFGISLKADSLP
jgi:hypothetical protein